MAIEKDERNVSHYDIYILTNDMLARRKMSVTELSDKVGITMANISVFRNGAKRKLASYRLWKQFVKRWNASRQTCWNI